MIHEKGIQWVGSKGVTYDNYYDKATSALGI